MNILLYFIKLSKIILVTIYYIIFLFYSSNMVCNAVPSSVVVELVQEKDNPASMQSMLKYNSILPGDYYMSNRLIGVAIANKSSDVHSDIARGSIIGIISKHNEFTSSCATSGMIIPVVGIANNKLLYTPIFDKQFEVLCNNYGSAIIMMGKLLSNNDGEFLKDVKVIHKIQLNYLDSFFTIETTVTNVSQKQVVISGIGDELKALIGGNGFFLKLPDKVEYPNCLDCMDKNWFLRKGEYCNKNNVYSDQNKFLSYAMVTSHLTSFISSNIIGLYDAKFWVLPLHDTKLKIIYKLSNNMYPNRAVIYQNTSFNIVLKKYQSFTYSRRIYVTLKDFLDVSHGSIYSQRDLCNCLMSKKNG